MKIMMLILTHVIEEDFVLVTRGRDSFGRGVGGRSRGRAEQDVRGGRGDQDSDSDGLPSPPHVSISAGLRQETGAGRGRGEHGAGRVRGEHGAGSGRGVGAHGADMTGDRSFRGRGVVGGGMVRGDIGGGRGRGDNGGGRGRGDNGRGMGRGDNVGGMGREDDGGGRARGGNGGARGDNSNRRGRGGRGGRGRGEWRVDDVVFGAIGDENNYEQDNPAEDFLVVEDNLIEDDTDMEARNNRNQQGVIVNIEYSNW